MAQLGMDADVIEHLGGQLKQRAGDIGTLISQINALVGQMQSNWWGPDAQRFCNDWWPQHRNELQVALQNIDGLGQAALNNATEQRNVSNH